MARPPVHQCPKFGGRLAMVRKKCGLTQAQFAKAVEVSPKTVDYYERRAPKPNVEFVMKAADALGVSVDYLLGYEKTKKRKPGPPPRMMTLMEDVLKLPKAKQKMAIQFLETLVKTG